MADVVVRRVGRCIYCGSRENLSTEHIVPRSLGGDHVLLEASCPSCRDATSRFERIVSGQDFLLFRTVLELPTYHPKSRPKTFRGRVRRGEVWTEEDIPVELLAGPARFQVRY